MYRRIMIPFQSKPDARPTFEDIFFKHYARLLEWAMQLTGRNRSDAEDLVQELYVRFAGAEPVGEHIENAEDYLFSVLRNLQYARVRRARTSAIDDLSVVDYDSAERGLRAIDRNGILFVREDLHRVCDYLCERKNTSRSASVFILRYFLGYFPYELMQIVQSTRSAIDKAVRAARNEARLDLERPGVLRQIGGTRDSKASAPEGTDDSQGLFLALRAKVFRSCIAECFGPSLLEERYEESGQGFTTTELAHLVSCPECLDRANRLLGLPRLSERSPDETIGRDTPPGPSGSAGAAPTLVSSRSKRKSEDPQRLRRRMERCLQEVNQHRPQRLLIAVDGDIRASQRVTAQLSELRVELRPMEKPTFIEVLSEQSICLAFILVQTLIPEGGLRQVQEIELSDDRTLKVAVSFAAESPTIEVVYKDPLIAMDGDTEEDVVEAFRVTVPKFEGIRSLTTPWSITITYLPTQLRRWFTRIPFPRMNPFLAGAMLFALCSVVCFVLWTKSGPRISARTLITRAEQSDASVPKSGDAEVIYQKVRISSPGHAMERAIYRDPERKRRLKQQQLSAGEQQTKDRLDQAGVSWDEPLSAANFSAWRDRQLVKKDAIARTGANLLTLTTSAAPDSVVVQESLTVRESDFHPIARTIELQNQVTVEIAELNYDVMPWGAVNQDWFEPLAGQGMTDTPGMHAALHIPHVLSELELDETELAARVALNQLHADTGEQIHLTRVATGIDVKGVVDTDSRKQAIISRLALLPNVHSSILSVEEIGSRPPSRSAFGGDQPIQAYSVEAQPSPLEQYLREKNMPLDQLGAISQSFLDESLRIQQAEVHLSELQQRFKEVNQLPADQQNQLTALSRNYINTIRAALEGNKNTLLAVGLDGAEPAASSSDANSPGGNLEQQVRHYQELCQQLITNGMGKPASAEVIAGELGTSSALIRSSATQMHPPISTAHN
jgi:DNA-directed RNA polymerase specialized sigma24 family protein